jgi:hypothetical protein
MTCWLRSCTASSSFGAILARRGRASTGMLPGSQSAPLVDMSLSMDHLMGKMSFSATGVDDLAASG